MPIYIISDAERDNKRELEKAVREFAAKKQNNMAGYSKTPFVKKMGFKDGMRAILINAPQESKKLFDKVPVSFVLKLSGKFDYIHLFATDEKHLTIYFGRVKNFLKPDGILWVSWPKSGKLGTNLNGNKVRDIGLAAGLVDIKVAAVDDIWSGLKFMYRLKDRQNP